MIGRMFFRLIPAPWEEKLVYVSKEVAIGFGGYIKAQLIIMSISMLISIVGLYIIGSEYALTLGLLAGFLELLPVLGPSMIYLPWIIWLVAYGDFTLAIKIGVLFVVLLTVRQMFEARIISANLGLHPLAVLAAMYIGLKLIGVTGLFIGPILLVALQAVIKAGIFKFDKAEEKPQQ
jgi:sporulation integral membrane protein YtvI